MNSHEIIILSNFPKQRNVDVICHFSNIWSVCPLQLLNYDNSRRQSALSSAAKVLTLKRNSRLQILFLQHLDQGVIRQRLMAEAFATAIGQITVYSTSTDNALTISQALTRSIRFLHLCVTGWQMELADSIFEQLGCLRTIRRPQIMLQRTRAPYRPD